PWTRRGADDADDRAGHERNRPGKQGRRQCPGRSEQQKLQVGMDAVRGQLEKDAPVPLVAHASLRPLKRTCGAAFWAAPQSLVDRRTIGSPWDRRCPSAW